MELETYYKKTDSGWEETTVKIKNGFPVNCMCGLYRSKNNGSKIKNCVHCTQQDLF